MARFIANKSHAITYDKDDRPVFMAESDWILKMNREAYPGIEFHFTSEFKTPQ